MPVALTPAQLETFKENRRKLLEELNSDEHYENTETVHYGEHDPFDVPMLPCDKCGSIGEIESARKTKGNNKYVIKCSGCGNHHKTFGTTKEQAILIWNSINPKGLPYKNFPMFGLANKTPEEASARIKSIRRNLEVRENISSLETTINPIIGKRPPALAYRHRLKLYLHWALWALAAIKLELPEKPRPPKKSE